MKRVSRRDRRTLMKLVAIAAVGLLSVQCSQEEEATPSSPSSGTQYVLALAADPDTIDGDGTSTSTISAVLTGDGSPIEDALLDFATIGGSVTPGVATTDSTGTATTVLMSDESSSGGLVSCAFGASAQDQAWVVFTPVTPDSGDTIGPLPPPSDTTGPASVLIYSVSDTVIYVAGSGHDETSMLTFTVLDSVGYPVNVPVDVDFDILGGPGGGEYLFPTSGTTQDSAALVSTYLNSGTISGPVRVVASVTGTTIQSNAIEVAIHGGPPVKEHLTVTTERLNIAGLCFYGKIDAITAFVFDQYANPVPPGTVVWFTSTYGNIYPGSGNTDPNGTVCGNDLISSNPLPPTGYLEVIGETVDGGGSIIADSTTVLFSGCTVLTLNPLSFSVPLSGSQTFTIFAGDALGHPVVGGSTIEISVSAGQVSVTGFEIPDALSGYTNYQFVLYNTHEPGDEPEFCTVMVTVTSENGNVAVAASGILQ